MLHSREFTSYKALASIKQTLRMTRSPSQIAPFDKFDTLPAGKLRVRMTKEREGVNLHRMLKHPAILYRPLRGLKKEE